MATLAPAPVAATGKRKKQPKKLFPAHARRSRGSFWQRSFNRLVVRMVLVAGVGIGGGVYQAMHHHSDTPGSSTPGKLTTSHAIAINDDGSITVTEGRVTFWFPTQGTRSVPTNLEEGTGAVYDAPSPSTVQVIVGNRTVDVTGREREEAERFMSPPGATWTVGNWQDIPVSSGSAYSVDMVLSDQRVEHVRLLVRGYSTVAVQAFASDTAATPALDHIWSSLSVDTNSSF